ncbi:hypothetical protein C8R45DRAFT_1077457 [Mycena sanguinolenta]|nr:hypothetical protein C8R45DRAFT_1077457 [Mycena sanguinolenta]
MATDQMGITIFGDYIMLYGRSVSRSDPYFKIRHGLRMPNSVDILPVELWDLVLQHLDVPLQSLLTLATVCQSFNRICIQRYLVCHGVSTESLAAGDIEIDGTHLPALLLSCYTPPIQRLSCIGSALLGNLKLTKRIVKKYLSLRELSLEFPRDILEGHADLCSHTRLTALYDLIHAMSSKIAGTVIVMSEGLLFRCTPMDILHWQLNEIPDEILSVSRMTSKFWRRPAGISAYAIVRDQCEQPVKVKIILSLSSMSIRCFWFQAWTLIVVNAESAYSLHLGTVGPPFAGHSLPGSKLSEILPLLTLPALRRVHLNTTTIDASVVADFILRHPAVTSLAYEPPETDIRPTIFLNPPVAHPGLTHIQVSDPIHIPAVLDSAGASPALAEISFPYIRGDLRIQTPAFALASALRRLAIHSRPVALTLTLRPPMSRRPLDAAEIAAAESLHCVVRIVAECPSTSDARTLLPWLSKLPALAQVEFRVGRSVFRWGNAKDPQTSGTLRFLDDAMQSLPMVAEVTVREVTGG